jgi:chaperone modulatory protein CbpM
MNTEEIISLDEFCTHHNIDLAFIYSLNEAGLIETIVIEEKVFLEARHLRHLERLVQFYYELGINIEGLETIHHLLSRMNEMQQQIITLSNRLRLYE